MVHTRQSGPDSGLDVQRFKSTPLRSEADARKRLLVFISQQVFVKSFCKSQFPHKSVNLSFILVTINDKLTDVCGD